MSIRPGGTAPYAPPVTILNFLERFRNQGLTTPITRDVLIRAGVPETLTPRTLRSLHNLELVDPKTGEPTPGLEGLRRASEADYKKRLEELVRGVYSEAFKFTDPATGDIGAVNDAFRTYEPIGQRRRMVALFLGLCRAAGIVSEGTIQTMQPKTRTKDRTKKKTLSSASRERKSAGSRQDSRGDHIPPAIGGLLESLPAEGESWTEAERTKFLDTFKAVLDFVVPVQNETELPESDADY